MALLSLPGSASLGGEGLEYLSQHDPERQESEAQWRAQRDVDDLL
jgi:hypothetical protein